MSVRSRIREDAEFSKEVWRRALDRLASLRRAGEAIHDEGDFIAREVDGAYRDRAVRHQVSDPNG